ncbi:MAG TPA: hypothetical protein VGY54_09540 [Polyangiaceae bacterium]|nr:hypothetical protein [Polyangiaceae bacterium]
MKRTALGILAIAALSVAGCGTSPWAAPPIMDSAVADVQSATDVQHDTEMETADAADRSDSGPGQCGCARAPVCGEPCQGQCGCCGCIAGEVLTVGSDVFRCSQELSCYQRVGDGGPFGTNSADAGTSDVADSASRDGSDANTGFACGTNICTAAQACVYSSGGGPPANCSPTNDAGQCPTGFSYMLTCPNLGNGPGCNAPISTPAPMGCLDLPASCGVTPTCGCFPSTACPVGTGSCQMVTAHALTCGAQ